MLLTILKYIGLYFLISVPLAMILGRLCAFNDECYRALDRRKADRRHAVIPVTVDRRRIIDRRRFILLANQHGAVAVTVAIFTAFLCLPLLGLTLGVGQMSVARNASQNAADAAALACSAGFYDPDNEKWPQPDTVEPAVANAVGHEIADHNGFSGCDIELGHWTFTGRAFNTLPYSGHMPDLSAMGGVEDAEVDTSLANACRVRCGYSGATYFMSWAFGGNTMATAAIVAQEATEGRTGVELTRGSHLVQ